MYHNLFLFWAKIDTIRVAGHHNALIALDELYIKKKTSKNDLEPLLIVAQDQFAYEKKSYCLSFLLYAKRF